MGSREPSFMTSSLPRRLYRTSGPSTRLTYGAVAADARSVASSQASSSHVATTRRRAYSATAAEVPAHHLSHVRSFPPQYSAAGMIHRRSESLPTTIAEDAAMVVTTMAEEIMPNDILRIIPASVEEGEETKEPIMDEEAEMENILSEDSDVDVPSPWGATKVRADTATSDTGGSIFSTEAPPPLAESPGGGVYLGRMDSYGEDFHGSATVSAPPPPIVLWGYLQLPLWCSKRRISWNRTYEIHHCIYFSIRIIALS
jgi:hypothetical protein